MPLPDLEISVDTIVVKTAAEWAVDTALYTERQLLYTSDEFYEGTNSQLYKKANGVDTWDDLDYFTDVQYNLISHTSNTSNPHNVTKAQVGLSNADNTSDANKPVSNAQATLIQSVSDLLEDEIVQGDADTLAAANTYSDNKIVQTIINGDTTHSSSSDALFDALVLKANLASPTFTGTITLPSTTSIGNVSSTELGYLDGVTSAIQTQINTKAATTYVDTSISTEVTNRNSAIASAIATEVIDRNTAISAATVGLLDDRGNFTPVGSYPSSGGSGSAGALLKGDLWTITGLGVGVTGTMGTKVVTDGDVVRALSDAPGQTESSWAIGENNFGYTALNAAIADGKMYIGNVSGIGTAVTLIGDVTVSNTGVTAIGASKVTNAMLAGSIAYSKLSLTGTIVNADLVNSSVTINGTPIALGASATITAAAGTLTGTTLNSTVVSSSLTSVGTVTTGAWNATKIGIAYGGTNLTTVASGSILAANLLDTLTAVTSASGNKGLINDAGVISWATVTGTGLPVRDTSPTFVTQIQTPLIQGGTGAASQLDLRGTNNASVTTTAIAIEHWIGNSGTTSGMRLYQDNQLLIGAPSATLVRNPSSPLLGIVRIGQGTSIIDMGEISTGIAGFWMNKTTPGLTNYTLKASTNATTLNDTVSVSIAVSNTSKMSFSATATTMSQALTMSDVNFILGTTTGSKLGTATSQKLGFWNATPIIQPASANQAALTDSTTGTPSFTLVDVGIAFSQANVNNNFSSLFRVLNEMRNVLVNTGLMKGSA